jgi:cyclic pyranopterin phosphate synthase
MPESGVEKHTHRDILSVEECVEISRAAVNCGVKKIRLTGGEPLVRHGILEICRGISAIGGLEELCMTTNGSLLPELAGPLKEAGVSRLNVSLDTLCPERFSRITRRGRLGDVLAGLEAAERVGFKNLKCNVVLIGGFNDGEIRDFVALTEHRPWEIRFIELMPMGQCTGWEKSRFLPAEEVLRQVPALRPCEPSGTAARYRVPGWAGTVGLIEPLSHRFCNRCDRIRVTADGKLKPCLHSEAELPLRGLHGSELEDAIRRGIAQKPEHHHLTDGGSDTRRNMNEIGG